MQRSPQEFFFRRFAAEQVVALEKRGAIDERELQEAKFILDAVRARGEAAIRQYAEQFADRKAGEPLVLGPEVLRASLRKVPEETRSLLTRIAKRIRTFATAQKKCLKPLSMKIPGGRAGHDLLPLERIGCYAPGGRYPLPSTVLMTAVTARVAGVKEVWLATPRPSTIMLAAAAIAEVDFVLAVGGPQAIGALAYGFAGYPRCDLIVGPGNKWVTAAKKLVAGEVAIDMLAGPTELVVLADGKSAPELIAADLLAQAEHDPVARPILVSLDERLVSRVEMQIDAQLKDLPSAAIARQALANGFAVVAKNLHEAIRLCDALAPEHLEICLKQPRMVAKKIEHAGAIFLGAGSAEVFGDYGFGPNHVLPTSGGARFTGGLSVLHFLRLRSWLDVKSPKAARGAREDAIALARLENLEAHARAAERRR